MPTMAFIQDRKNRCTVPSSEPHGVVSLKSLNVKEGKFTFLYCLVVLKSFLLLQCLSSNEQFNQIVD